ncbi:glycosyltransferase family 25 protein [Psychrobacter sp. FDAARGOS_221]|uniref:glycosyltransferase family 25 protein n=1 Tax=Psychrobacter sp. FDAARGOS_221 TaxID=1975705 RepID=UPI000BB56528|nr:glycosyltransferase family 25 protein [Psychrobacter sp. FDAARGOS_221]PNK59480.1 glycosyl transferase [Psychrobacter sp. FDAARGOS_221]
MKNYVISLKSATERRQHIKKEFGKQQVDFEFFDALTPETAKQYITDKALPFELEPDHLTPVELACMMSHVAVWKKALDEGVSHFTVFEDDVYLGQDAAFFLNNSDWIKPSWDIIKIETVDNKVLLNTKKQTSIEKQRQLIPLKGKHLGAGAYTLSRQGAQKVLNYTLQHIMLPIDETVFRDLINENVMPVYQMVPALCIQDIILNKSAEALVLPSTLEEDRRKRMRSEKKKGLAKIRREANRLVDQTKDALFAKSIPFR